MLNISWDPAVVCQLFLSPLINRENKQWGSFCSCWTGRDVAVDLCQGVFQIWSKNWNSRRLHDLWISIFPFWTRGVAVREGFSAQKTQKEFFPEMCKCNGVSLMCVRSIWWQTVWNFSWQNISSLLRKLLGIYRDAGRCLIREHGENLSRK